MVQYEISESTSHRPRSVQAGPSGIPTGVIHPSRRRGFEDVVSSYVNQDTQEEAEYRCGFLRGRNGSSGGIHHSDESDAVPEGNLPGPNPPGPPGPTPSERRRRKRKPEVVPIKLKDPKAFEGKPGDDFNTWSVMVQTYIHDQPETFEDKG